MKIIYTRRLSQIMFFALFVWLCIVSTVGDKFWQIRNWPVNFFFNLDPLVSLGTILTTHKLFEPLAWSIVTIVLTIIFGRFFCGWVCPLGAMHHFIGWLTHRKNKNSEKIRLNQYRKAQSAKYYILIVLLFMAAFPSLGASLQTGFLDPIPMITRTFAIILMPICDSQLHFTSISQRFSENGWIFAAVFFAFAILNCYIPRFFCRFVCPLGAFFGLISRFAPWRIGKKESECINCRMCQKACEGSCEPAGEIKISECVLCFNCVDDCSHNLIGYNTFKSNAGEITNPDISRRGFAISVLSGFLAVPAIRLSGKIASNWYYKVIRPPGSESEPEFLKKCIKCGMCMRVCPTNVIQPAGIQGGIEGLWTPILNNRIGASGCQINCVACGQVCPTAAIKPISLDEKLGKGEYAQKGPIKLGTAFVDRNRCLPWSMGIPCIVCEENCPVSPKAIYTKDVFETVRDGIFKVKSISGNSIEIQGDLKPDAFATGDYYCLFENGKRFKISDNSETKLGISLYENDVNIAVGCSIITIQVLLKTPYVDVEKCIGCGICEHECPVTGIRAISVSAEGESRSRDRKLYLKT